MSSHAARVIVRWVAMAASIVLPTAASAQVSVHAPGDVFDAPPPAASTRGKRACAPAQRYVDLIAAERYDELGTLFADDAVFLTPIGKVLHGPREIGDFYKAFLPTIKPRNVPITFIADGDECVMELVTATNLDNYARYRLAAIDHFTVNKQGKIRHMVVFLRPQPPQMPQKSQ
jgi:hypothetical protein